MIAQGKTGSGKTAAFGLGLLARLDVKRFRIQSLVLCPTRELADQVAKEIRKLAQALCTEFGHALVSTSANPAGLTPARTTQEIEHYFGNHLDYILDGECNPDAQPSRIIDLVSGRVIRD